MPCSSSTTITLRTVRLASSSRWGRGGGLGRCCAIGCILSHSSSVSARDSARDDLAPSLLKMASLSSPRCSWRRRRAIAFSIQAFFSSPGPLSPFFFLSLSLFCFPLLIGENPPAACHRFLPLPLDFTLNCFCVQRWRRWCARLHLLLSFLLHLAKVSQPLSPVLACRAWSCWISLSSARLGSFFITFRTRTLLYLFGLTGSASGSCSPRPGTSRACWTCPGPSPSRSTGPGTSCSPSTECGTSGGDSSISCGASGALSACPFWTAGFKITGAGPSGTPSTGSFRLAGLKVTLGIRFARGLPGHRSSFLGSSCMTITFRRAGPGCFFEPRSGVLAEGWDVSCRGTSGSPTSSKLPSFSSSSTSSHSSSTTFSSLPSPTFTNPQPSSLRRTLFVGLGWRSSLLIWFLFILGLFWGWHTGTFSSEDVVLRFEACCPSRRRCRSLFSPSRQRRKPLPLWGLAPRRCHGGGCFHCSGSCGCSRVISRFWFASYAWTANHIARIQSKLSLQTNLSSSSERSLRPNRSYPCLARTTRGPSSPSRDRSRQTLTDLQGGPARRTSIFPLLASCSNHPYKWPFRRSPPFVSSMQMMTTPFFSCAIQNFGSSPEKRCTTKVFAR